MGKSWWEGERAFGAGAVAMEPVRLPVQWGEHGDPHTSAEGKLLPPFQAC